MVYINKSIENEEIYENQIDYFTNQVIKEIDLLTAEKKKSVDENSIVNDEDNDLNEIIDLYFYFDF